MLSVLADPILPVFFVMVLGFIFGKAGVFSEDMARSLNTFIFYIGQPSLIFVLAAKAPCGEYNLPALGLYLLSELLLYFGITFSAA